MDTRQYIEANQDNWNERVAIHAEAPNSFYDIDGFLAGDCTLQEVELSQLGDVTGKRLLHAMLSWARRGAVVTGVDFSQDAIALARDLAARSGQPATFACAGVTDLPASFRRQFDIVFASYGVLCWLPDIDRFVQSLATCLKQGGVFCLIDGHPFLDMFEYDEASTKLELRHSYFHSRQPDRCNCTTSYANKARALENSITYQWSHDLQSILEALSANDLELLSFREYPFGFYQKYPHMVQNAKGQWVFPEGSVDIPLLMSIRARKCT
jgi:SAM-dependent methyltransferase